MSDAQVHVVVVAYFGADALGECLTAIKGVYPVTVVDNSSDAGVRAVAEAAGARYLDAGVNRGFAAGVNTALRALDPADRSDVLLLNPDAVMDAEGVAELREHLHRPGRERVCALSPQLRSLDGVSQRVLWPFPSPGRAWLEACGLGRLNRSRDFAVGAVLLLRREAIDQVGLFDERFFLYSEETDWQRRARALGWSVALVHTVDARHVGAGTSGDARRREALFHAGSETYVRKWFGAWGWALYRAAVIAGAVPRWVLLAGHRRSAAAERARLYWRGPRRAAGLEVA